MKAELITRHELEKNIMNGLYGELDFYAYCNTPWHSMGVQAFVNELASKKKRVRGIIFISNQPGRSHLLNPEQFKVNSNVEVLYFKNKEAFRKNKTKLLISLLCSRRKITDDYPLLYVLRPFRPDIRFGAEYIMNTGRNCNLVCIDEGVGTYKSNKEIFEEKFKGNKKDALIYAMSSVLNKILKKKFGLKIIKYTLFDSKDDRLVLNAKVALQYQNLLINNVERVSAPTINEYAILLTQPFEIVQDIECRDAINISFDYVKEFLQNRGIEVYIKPHPREEKKIVEEYRKRGYGIIESNWAVEKYLASVERKPRIVFGALSTALITVSILNQCNAFSTVELISDKLSVGYLKSVKKYKKRYSGYVRFPSTYREVIIEDSNSRECN